VWIDQAYCTGSGLCELIEPRVFAIGDDGLARVRRGDDILPPGPDNAVDVPPGCEDEVRDAAESCPGGCIRVEPRPLPHSMRRSAHAQAKNNAAIHVANDLCNSTMSARSARHGPATKLLISAQRPGGR
jgi:ferredoxin